MKKYSILIAAFALALLAGACAKDSAPEQGAPKGTVLKASLSSLTKTAIDGVKVSWTAGDKIIVNGATSTALEDAAATAKFEFMKELSAPYKAIYPTSIYKEGDKVSLPASWNANAFKLPLYGYLADGDEISFKALTALLKISITGDAATTVKDISLKGLGDEQLCGEFSLDYTTGALTGTSTAEADKVVKVNVNEALSATALVVYIPIPAGSYPSGYQIEILNSEGGLMRKSVTARTVVAGELRIMDPLAFEVNVADDTPLGGIPDAAELKAFATAVNDGRSLNRWLNKDGEVELLADIDLGGAEWTPIGNGSVTTSATEPLAADVVAFTGVFDGKNHTVDNFTVTVSASASNVAGGLFGVVKGATLKNLTIGDKAVIKTSSNSGFVTLGAVVGFASESTLSNLDSYAKLINDGGKDNVRMVIGGTVGSMFSNTASCTATDLKGHANFDVVNNVNTKNGGTGFIVGGVVGWTDGVDYANTPTLVKGCVNYSSFSVQATRTGGVIGTMNTGSHAEDCVNYGNISCTDVKASNSRPAGIVSAMGNKTTIKGCINYGDIAFPVAGDDTHGYAAGVVGQTNDTNEYFTYIDGCATYGTIQSDRWFNATEKFMGIICASFNAKKVTVKNCILGGKIGPYTTDSTPLVTLDATNFADYYSLTAANRIASVLFENNSFGTKP